MGLDRPATRARRRRTDARVRDPDLLVLLVVRDEFGDVVPVVRVPAEARVGPVVAPPGDDVHGLVRRVDLDF
jgi:hypothetical protein